MILADKVKLIPCLKTPFWSVSTTDRYVIKINTQGKRVFIKTYLSTGYFCNFKILALVKYFVNF